MIIISFLYCIAISFTNYKIKNITFLSTFPVNFSISWFRDSLRKIGTQLSCAIYSSTSKLECILERWIRSKIVSISSVATSAECVANSVLSKFFQALDKVSCVTEFQAETIRKTVSESFQFFYEIHNCRELVRIFKQQLLKKQVFIMPFHAFDDTLVHWLY